MKRIALGVALFVVAVTLAHAQNYPARPIKIIVNGAAGGSGDVLVRIIAEELGKSNATVVVENMPGAAGLIGTQAFLRAAPDGYTIGFSTSSSLGIAPFSLKSVNYDPITDFTHITRVARYPYLVVADASLGYNNLSEMVADAKKNPGKLTNGYYSDTLQVVNTMFKKVVGIDAVGVPYKASTNVMFDVMGSRLSFAAADAAAIVPLMSTGKLNALVALTPKRVPALPNVPTLTELGYPPFEVTGWVGFSGPKGIPNEAVEWLDSRIQTALRDPVVAARIDKLGLEISVMGTAEFNSSVAKDLPNWKRLVQEAGIEPR